MATIKEIGEIFLARRAEIDALDQALASERRKIQNDAIDQGRLMNEEDIARRKEIGATRQELAEASEILALSTLDKLKTNDDIEALNAELLQINEVLKDDLAHLETIEGYGETVAKVAAGLARAATKVVGVVL